MDLRSVSFLKIAMTISADQYQSRVVAATTAGINSGLTLQEVLAPLLDEVARVIVADPNAPTSQLLDIAEQQLVERTAYHAARHRSPN